LLSVYGGEYFLQLLSNVLDRRQRL